MNIDKVLANLPDDDDELILSIPRADDLVAMDDAFVASEYELAIADEPEADASTFSKRDQRPLRKQRTAKECRSASELAELDRLMLKSVGL